MVKGGVGPKNVDRFNLLIYNKQILFPEKNWNLTVNNDFNAKIKLFENADNTADIKNVSDLKI